MLPDASSGLDLVTLHSVLALVHEGTRARVPERAEKLALTLLCTCSAWERTPPSVRMAVANPRIFSRVLIIFLCFYVPGPVYMLTGTP